VGQLGTILEMTGKISSFPVGPVVAMFLLGMLVKRANAPGVFAGTLCGLAVVAWLSPTVFWLWWGIVGLAVSALSGYVFSLAWSTMRSRA